MGGGKSELPPPHTLVWMLCHPTIYWPKYVGDKTQWVIPTAGNRGVRKETPKLVKVWVPHMDMWGDPGRNSGCDTAKSLGEARASSLPLTEGEGRKVARLSPRVTEGQDK